MSFKKFRWSQVYESSEEELVALLQARNIRYERVHAVASAQQIAQHAESATTIWCAEGSLVVKAESIEISLQPGDALRLAANTSYTIVPGISDCAYYLTR